MRGRNLRRCFQFYDDLVIDEEIQEVFLFESSVSDADLDLGCCMQSRLCASGGQFRLINLLVKETSELVMNVKCDTPNLLIDGVEFIF